VIFDLDNVLYDEGDYVIAAYRKIASFLSERCSLSEEEICSKLVSDLRRKGSMYPRLFNDLLAELKLDQSLVPDLLKLYASATLDLSLFPDAEDALRVLREQRIKLGLVTNGNVAIQRNKIRLLKLERCFDAIVYAREVGKADKPDPEAYRFALEALGVKPEETICVGDNPYTDFWGAKKLGIQTVRVCRGEFKDVRLSEEFEADITVRTLSEICSLINQTNELAFS